MLRLSADRQTRQSMDKTNAMPKLSRRYAAAIATVATAFASLALALPASAVPGGYTSLRTVYTADAGTGILTDRTTAAGNATANDVPLGGDHFLDAIYFGSEIKFENMILTIGTGTAGGGAIRWDYWNGMSYTPLSGVSQTWTTAGSFAINFSAPSDWAKTTINGVNRYWIRVAWITTRADGSVEPLLTQASVLFLNYQVTVRDEFGGGIGGLSDLNFILSNCSDTAIYKVKDYGTGLYELALLTSGADTTCDLRIEQTNYYPSATVSTGALSSSIQQNGGVISLSYLASASQSTVSANPGTIPSDNVTPSQITVTVKNWNNMPLAGRTVTLASDHAGDTITGSPTTTNGSGVASFNVKSSNAGAAHYTATAAGTIITQQATVTYTAIAPPPDAVAPTVGTLSPTSVTAMAATTISATYSDNVGVAACDLLLDGVNAGAMTLSAPGGTSGIASRSVTLSAGNHTARASCRDAVGNNGQGSNVTITASAAPAADATPPTVGTPAPTTATINVSQTYTASVSDNVGISECSFYVDGAAQATSVLAGSAQIGFAFTSTGSHSMFVRCADGAGNIGTGPTTTITVAAAPPPPADNTPSPTTSLVDASPSTVVANGSDLSTVTVTVKNAGGVGLSGKTVTLASNRPSVDTIAILSGTTNAFGQATFTVRSSAAGSSVLTATVEGIIVGDTATITFTASGSPPPPPPSGSGRRIKLACPSGVGINHPCKAVYFVAPDGKRHAFPNDKVYFTWFSNFTGVEIVSSSELSLFPLGKNVTYRPGSKMVKFVTLPKVYSVSRNGELHWVVSEAVAQGLFGSDWNHKIDDINDAFFLDYAFGADQTPAADFDVTADLFGTIF